MRRAFPLIEGLLLGLAGNGIYSIIQNTIVKLTSNKDDDLYERIYLSLDNATQEFFKVYKKEYPRPNDSFLARENNIDLIIQYVFYDQSINLFESLERKGFEDSKELSETELNFFLNAFINTAKKDIKLNRIITENEHYTQSKKMGKNVEKILDVVQQKNPDEQEKNSKASKNYKMIDESTGEEIEYVEGKKQHFHFPNGVQYTLLMKDDKIFVDMTDPEGKVQYMELDKDFNVKQVDPPYPLAEYSLAIPDNEILSKHTTQISKDVYKENIKLKWGRNAEVYYDRNHEIIKVHNTGNWKMDHQSKTIYPFD